MTFLAAIDYSVFPPINAALNGLSTVLLVTGFLLIKSGRVRAHLRVMIGALVSSTVFLGCYLFYHYGAGHTEFPREYPLARKIYLAILAPHILLAVLNLPFILLIVVAAVRGRFQAHKRVARWVFPSWLFVSVTGVIIYFMIYQWFPASAKGAADSPGANTSRTSSPSHPRIPGPTGGLAAVNPPAAVSAPAPTAASPAAPAAPATVLGRRDGHLFFTPAEQVASAEPGQASVAVQYTVENSGEVPVRIARLESGCECLEVSIDRNPVPAQGTATITGLFDVSKLRGSAERKIVVTPEGRERPVLLNARIEIEPVYEIVEAMTTWAKDSEPVTKTVQFRVVREAPVHVLSAESKRPEVACKLVEVEKGRLYHLELTPTTTEKTLLGIVRLETDCEVEGYARPLAYYSIQ